VAIRPGEGGDGTNITVAAPEFGRIWGGIGTYLGQLLRGIGNRHDVTVLSGHRPATSDPFVRTVPLTDGGNVMGNYLEFQLALRRRLPRLIREHRPDLLIVHHAQMPDLLARTNGCPVVVTTHTTVRGQAQASWDALRQGSHLDESERITLAALPALLPAEMYYWRRVRHALFVSGAVQREARGAYNPRLATSAVIPNGLSLQDERPPSTERPDPGFILYTGRLLGWKGLGVLLQSLMYLRRKERLVVTGSGEILAWQRYARALGLPRDRVEFLGAVPRQELLARLASADLVVLPSFMESCPYSLIEAMALGKPIVATAVPGIQDMVVDGTSALLVPHGNPRALAVAMERVLEDHSLRQQLGHAASAVAAERFSLERMCTSTMEYFERVLAAS